MNFKQYQREAKRTNAPMPESYENMTEMHMILGMLTEVGELADLYKKNLAYGKPIDVVNEAEEVADIMWYLVNFCDIRCIDLGEQLQKNIDKLKNRFPNKFDKDLAIHRDVEAERKILEETNSED